MESYMEIDIFRVVAEEKESKRGAIYPPSFFLHKFPAIYEGRKTEGS